MSHRVRDASIIVAGSVVTSAFVTSTIDDGSSAIVILGLLLGGPAWCYAIALASDESDFAGSDRSRHQWLATLPWTFLVAPLVLPNLVILAAFVRDSRVDGGRSPLTWDRMRPGEAAQDHHWPE